MKHRALIALVLGLSAVQQEAPAQTKGGSPYTYYHVEHLPRPPYPPPPYPPSPLPPPWWPTYRPWPYPVPVPYPVPYDSSPTIVQNYYTGPAGEGAPSSAVLPPPKPTQAVLAILVPTTQTDVWVDGNKMAMSWATTRVYTSPDLEPGHSYEYTVKAQWVQRGSLVNHTEKVVVRPGKTTQVDFTKYAPR